MKLICFLKKRPDISHEEFRQRYEDEHAPLVAKLVPYFAEYRRSYIQRGPALNPEVRDIIPFDVVTELWFDTQDDYERFIAGLQVPETQRALAACEERFLDLDHLTMYVVDEARTPGTSGRQA